MVNNSAFQANLVVLSCSVSLLFVAAIFFFHVVVLQRFSIRLQVQEVESRLCRLGEYTAPQSVLK